MGALVTSFEIDGETYEIWKGSLKRLPVQQMLRRIQILVPLFIEGGTYIDLKDEDWSLDRWTVFFLYKRVPNTTKSPYMFMGYSTVYRFYYFESQASPSPSNPRSTRLAELHGNVITDFELPQSEGEAFNDFPCRSRISQFIILPPFQQGGHGSRLYSEIYAYYRAHKQTVELTVEDPNEAFDDMRDVNDLLHLRTDSDFLGLKINSAAKVDRKGIIPLDIVDPIDVERCRRKVKIAPRQFARLVEMQLLSQMPKSITSKLALQALADANDSEGEENDDVREALRGSQTLPLASKTSNAEDWDYRLWQLQCKRRLYLHNRAPLLQLDLDERIPRLEGTLMGIGADYLRLLDKVQSRSKQATTASSTGIRKRTHSDGTLKSKEEALVAGRKKARQA